MEETIKQNKTPARKEFEKLLSEDLNDRKFTEGEVARWACLNGQHLNRQIITEVHFKPGQYLF